MPISSFSQSKPDVKKICELGVGGSMYLQFSDKLKAKFLGHIDTYFAIKDGLLEEFDDYETGLSEKEREAISLQDYKQKSKLKKESQEGKYNADFFCKREIDDENMQKEMSDELQSLLSDLSHMNSYKNLTFATCIQSENPINFVAKLIDIPSKHIRDYKMLTREIKERLGEAFDNKNICNIDSSAKTFINFSMPKKIKKNEALKSCKSIIELNLVVFQRLNNCRPRT
jgi:hypothetical protein